MVFPAKKIFTKPFRDSVKVVIDTNVYLSSLLFKGTARLAYDRCIEMSDVYISDFIASEVSEKLQTKFSLSVRKTREIISSILSVTELTVPSTPIPDICRDADDNNVLQLCESVSADFLVTGDKDLLDLKQFKSTIIVNPGDFVAMLS